MGDGRGVEGAWPHRTPRIWRGTARTGGPWPSWPIVRGRLRQPGSPRARLTAKSPCEYRAGTRARACLSVTGTTGRSGVQVSFDGYCSRRLCDGASPAAVVDEHTDRTEADGHEPVPRTVADPRRGGDHSVPTLPRPVFHRQDQRTSPGRTGVDAAMVSGPGVLAEAVGQSPGFWKASQSAHGPYSDHWTRCQNH